MSDELIELLPEVFLAELPENLIILLDPSELLQTAASFLLTPPTELPPSLSEQLKLVADTAETEFVLREQMLLASCCCFLRAEDGSTTELLIKFLCFL
jgi:hypothetical protein